MKRFLLFICSYLLLSLSVQAQNNATVLDPTDVVSFLDANAPKPAIPANNNIIYKWYATKKLSWNTTNYKAYIFNGMGFRLRFPKNYNPADATKKYPLILMLHGKGEIGDPFDNDLQLANGGQLHDNAVINDKFDGFLLFPQVPGEWEYSSQDKIIALLNIIVANANVDVDRLVVHGLSNGGAGTAGIIGRYPKTFAAALPMSVIGNWNNLDAIIYMPIWISQGGLDTSPKPSFTDYYVNELKNKGANVIYSLYPDLGHGVWNTTYANPDFFPYITRAHKANPLVFFGRTEFCAGDAISVKMGLSAGFDGYQWRKDGLTISGATSNTYTATQLGTYEARLKRGTVWSPWSPTPVIVKEKEATISPNITVAGLNSSILPSGDGSTSVTLEVPNNFTEYTWKKVGSNTVLGTSNQLVVSQAGSYVVKVKELYGCSSSDSQPFVVLPVNGANRPDAVTAFNANTISKTAITLNWTDVASPQNNETAFEIYRSATAGSGYKMIKIIGADIHSYTDSLLPANTQFFYKIRSINLSGASANSIEVNATTLRDNNPPTAPGNLRISAVSRDYIDIVWEQSTDDVGVAWYDIYVNGQKTYSTEADNNNFRIASLTYGNVYTIKVLAKDISGNLSTASNQVTAKTVNNGFNYKYYEGTWSTLPNFDTLTPAATGNVDDISLAVRGRDTNFAILYEGYINIPVTGNYTFETYSDDGSKMYIGNYDFNATALVDNDGAHGNQYREGTVNLTAGPHPITVTYLQIGGGYGMQLYWKNTANGVTSRQLVPKSFFIDGQNTLVAPAKVSNVNAVALTYNKINLSWTDNANNETGFEIYRANNVLGPFSLVKKVAANTVNYIDDNLTAETNYFYKIKTVGDTGESDFAGTFQELKLNFDNSFADESSFDRNATGVNGATFSTTKKVGTHSLSLDGTNDYVKIGNTSTGGFLNTAFNSRTISFWFQPQLLTQTRTLLDVGSSSNGLSLRTNTTNLELGIASNNVRKTLSTPITLNTWYLVTVVYQGNSLKLYMNGTLVKSADDLTFSSVLATTDGAAIGYRNGSNAFNSNTNYYTKGLIDQFLIYDNALSASEIQSLYALTPIDAKAKTTLTPPAPVTPTGLLATTLSTNRVKINWNVDSTSVVPVTYALYKSVGDSTNFAKIFEQETLNGSLVDSNLLAHTKYYYKIKASHAGGESAFSSSVFATTNNSIPVIQAITDKTIRFDQASVISLAATDADSDSITFSLADNLTFASIEMLNANTAKLNINPSLEVLGSYNLKVLANDNHGGLDTATFNLVINQNYTPQILVSQSTVTLNEGASTVLNILANDENENDSLSFSLSTTAPGFVSIDSIINRQAKLLVKPLYTDAGTYSFYVKTEDQNGGIDSTMVSLTVNDIDLSYKIYVNFAASSSQGGYWNNTTNPVNGKVFVNLKNDKLAQTQVGLTVTSDWQTWWGSAANDGMYSSTLYPYTVTNTNWSVNATTQTFKLTGLTSSLKYDISFLASSKYATGNYNTTVTSGNISESINATNNDSQLITLTSLRPNGDGEINISVTAPVDGYAVLSAMLINADVATVSVPAAPTGLTAVYDNLTKKVKLNWTDVAVNESSYDIYKADSLGQFSLLTHLGANKTEYLDAAIIGTTTYKYKIAAVNEIGSSAFTNVAEVTTPEISTVVTGYKVYVNFGANSSQGGYWNNTTNPVNGNVLANLKNDKLEETSVGLAVTSNWQSWWGSAGNDGMYSDVLYPYSVTNSNWSVNNGTQTFKLTGLSSSLKYDLSFLSSSKYSSGNYTTTIASGDVSQTINAYNNATQLITLPALRANEDGEINVSISSATGGFGVISAMVINAETASVAVPAAPTNLTAVYDNGTKKIKLTWNDVAVNETGYDIYRTDSLGQFSLLTHLNADVSFYDDAAFIGNAQLSYKVAAVNDLGLSGFTNIVEVTTPNRIPTISNIIVEDMVTGTSKTINITATDDASDVLTFSGINLPTFASINNLSNGSAQLVLNPTLLDAGVYAGVIVKVADNHGGFAADTLNINVINDAESVVKINFNQGTNQASPWNNTDAAPNSGYTLSNIKDTNGNNTGLSLQLNSTWSGANNLGENTGNNSGTYPDNVMSTFYFDYTGQTRDIKIGGLNPNKQYSFEFFASWDNPWAQAVTNYHIGSKIATLDPAYNLTRTAIISNIVANQNGEATITLERASGSDFLFIGALTIKAYAYNGVPQAPANLSAIGKSKSAINLTWEDQSANEDGFEIYRASSQNGTYTLLTTTAASVTSYVDNALSANSTYWYKVRAVRNDNNNSVYSNITSGSTYAYVVSVNFNREDAAPSPWNNTNKNPEDGDRFSNLKDDSNSSTSISLTMVDNFTAANNLGVVTGNNSGKYPDVVNKWFYYSEKNETARIKLSGLNQTLAYDLEFFGSWFQPFANGNSSYTVNGTKVLLDPANNTTNTASIINVLPDANGEIYMDIFMQPEAQYAFLNALIVKAHAAPTNGGQLLNVKNKFNVLEVNSGIETSAQISVYPNPFMDYLEVDLNAMTIEKGKVNLQLIDLSGKILKNKDVNLNGDVKKVMLSLQDISLQSGVYLLKVNNGTSTNVLKVVKR